uniref:Uncharacterized protein n=1 Tax=Colletotrichum fructicola (strain Nara gc5) TaxID=1213859 RepID=L2GGG6_COLFN
MWTPASRGWAVRLSGILVLFALLRSIVAQDLGLNLDTNARDKAQQMVYSSKLTFTQDTITLFNDDQLYELAHLAYIQMQTKFDADRVRPQEQPAMMAVMAVEKDVFISSSLKGSGPSLYSLAPQHSKPRVVAALDRCQARLQSQKKVPVNKKHRTEAGCAEIFAVHQPPGKSCSFCYQVLPLDYGANYRRLRLTPPEYHLDSDASQRAHNHPRSIRVVAYGKGGQTGVVGREFVPVLPVYVTWVTSC